MMRSRLILLLALACVAVARNTDEATCPPARFISCGPEPQSGTCLAFTVNDETLQRECCWVTNTSDSLQTAAWATTYFAPAGDALVGLPTQFGIGEDQPIMEAEFNLLTRVASKLVCLYYVTQNCGTLGLDAPLHVLTLRATDPSRFLVSEAVSRFTARETTANPDEFVCDCDRKDALPLPERYRCCYWDSGVPDDQPTPAVMRTTACRAPRAVARGEQDCRRTLRPISQCGDSGACYCRFEYNTAAGATRDPWGCGQCCPALTPSFGHDQMDKLNNTRSSCLSTIFPFTPANDGVCEDKLLELRTQIFSSASRLDIPGLSAAATQIAMAVLLLAILFILSELAHYEVSVQ